MAGFQFLISPPPQKIKAKMNIKISRAFSSLSELSQNSVLCVLSVLVRMSLSLNELLSVNSACDLSLPIDSSIPRWQRKALAGVNASMNNSALNNSELGAPAPRAELFRPDRCIPSRTSLGFDSSSLENAAVGARVEEALSSELEGSGFTSALASSLIMNRSSAAAETSESLSGSRVLAFKSKAPVPAEGHVNSLKVLYSQQQGRGGSVGGLGSSGMHRTTRHIASAPEKILDAPALVDDYYLKLLDWSCNNTLAVALGPSVYMWNASAGTIAELLTLTSPDDYVTSVAWIKEGGGVLAVGTASADVQLWDAEKCKQVRSMKGHAARVGALDWNSHLLTSGSRDTSIVHHDVRVREHAVATLQAHTQEVCGLKWSPDGALLASGGNDNTLCIWDAIATGGGGAPNFIAPRHTLTDHQAAVKALAWCPWQRGVLASGGGTADRSIKVWNAAQGALLSTTDTGSQVCALAFNPHERELLSSHGFSQNQLALWKFPTMSKLKELTGHTARVLHLAVSPDGATVCSAGADETLRFGVSLERLRGRLM